jgi:hypothetical protein
MCAAVELVEAQQRAVERLRDVGIVDPFDQHAEQLAHRVDHLFVLARAIEQVRPSMQQRVPGAGRFDEVLGVDVDPTRRRRVDVHVEPIESFEELRSTSERVFRVVQHVAQRRDGRCPDQEVPAQSDRGAREHGVVRDHELVAVVDLGELAQQHAGQHEAIRVRLEQVAHAIHVLHFESEDQARQELATVVLRELRDRELSADQGCQLRPKGSEQLVGFRWHQIRQLHRARRHPELEQRESGFPRGGDPRIDGRDPLPDARAELECLRLLCGRCGTRVRVATPGAGDRRAVLDERMAFERGADGAQARRESVGVPEGAFERRADHPIPYGERRDRLAHATHVEEAEQRTVLATDIAPERLETPILRQGRIRVVQRAIRGVADLRHGATRDQDVPDLTQREVVTLDLVIDLQQLEAAMARERDADVVVQLERQVERLQSVECVVSLRVRREEAQRRGQTVQTVRIGDHDVVRLEAPLGLHEAIDAKRDRTVTAREQPRCSRDDFDRQQRAELRLQRVEGFLERRVADRVERPQHVRSSHAPRECGTVLDEQQDVRVPRQQTRDTRQCVGRSRRVRAPRRSRGGERRERDDEKAPHDRRDGTLEGTARVSDALRPRHRIPYLRRRL